jgi:pantoate--beta-alanine ligase
MQIARTIEETRRAVAAARSAGRPIGFIPTMGTLHAGHLSLIEVARRDQAFVVVSIFVNPTQFGPGEDFSRYPRDTEGDLNKCRAAGVDLAFLPSTDQMYPPDASTTVHVVHLTETLCGPHRPGHFDGVTTVVAKLLNIVQPDAAYFGQKDAQQLAVIRRMVRDLNVPVRIVGCPTMREPDGLAMSSRNAYLSPEDRRLAQRIHRALAEAQQQIEAGERDAGKICATMRRTLDAPGRLWIDYASVVDAETMQPVQQIERPVLVAVAARIGETRLIDNVSVDP